ncbi:PLC-like phosphodiesterase [Crucibulum laeve]|uniref:PLC-like phosphodiesterase n=1 Tax=Crucibulum laeve TaxID=68775 RepID=A0A5C3LN67_9AGAR|nr:PLC-like phosphodiesterase [Crucibulum laeve]
MRTYPILGEDNRGVNKLGEVVTTPIRSIAREAQQVWDNPTPINIISAPWRVVNDVAHNNPVVGHIIDTIDGALHPVADRSTWMGDHRDWLGGKRINQISLPGTHDAGTFDLSLNKSSDAASLVGELSKYPLTSGVIRSWAKTQSLTFTGQLYAGVRFFDLRIGVSLNDDDRSLRFVHSVESNDTVRSLLEPMGTWMREHKDELIILDVQHLYNFDSHATKYDDLLTTFRDIFGSLLVPWSYFKEEKPFASYISSGKRVILLLPPAPAGSTPKIDFWVRGESFKSKWFPDAKTIDDLALEVRTNEIATRLGTENKIHGFGMGLSPPESPSSFGEGLAYGTMSLKQWGPDRNNHRVKSLLEQMDLKGRGWIICMDFIETDDKFGDKVPNSDVIDYTISLNNF